MSIILGTVAVSYGSVPMYKMVCYPNVKGSCALCLTFHRRYVNRQAGVVSPSKPPCIPLQKTLLHAFNLSRPLGGCVSPSMALCRMFCHGSSRLSKEKYGFYLARQPWPSTRQPTRATTILSAWQRIVSRQGKWRRISARYNASASRSRG